MCLGGIRTEVGFTVVLFHGWGGGVKYCWNRCCNFSFRNKFIIVLPCCLLVDNNTFSKMCVLKVLLATLMMVVMKTEMCMF